MNDKNKLDYRQFGGGAATGGGFVAIVLAILQSQGVGVISKEYNADIKIALEKTVENSNRINRIEDRIQTGIRELSDKITQLSDTVMDETKDRYTRQDHKYYSEQVNSRFERIESRLLLIKADFNQKIWELNKNRYNEKSSK